MIVNGSIQSGAWLFSGSRCIQIQFRYSCGPGHVGRVHTHPCLSKLVGRDDMLANRSAFPPTHKVSGSNSGHQTVSGPGAAIEGIEIRHHRIPVLVTV